MQGWKQSDIERLSARGMIVPTVTAPRINVLRGEAKPLTEMKKILSYMQVEFQSEYKFLDNRKFRFDIYIEVGTKKIGIEYDGLVSAKSRHTSLVGFSKDTEKMNLAAMHGFIVLRYTILTYQNFINDISFLI